MESLELKYFKGFFTPFFDVVETSFEQFSKEKVTPRTSNYRSLVRAAFTKCFEFNYAISRKKEVKTPFFLLGTLRSICEDLIALSFLKTLKTREREQLIEFNHAFDITKNLIIQDEFFKKYNQGQFIVKPEHFATLDDITFPKEKPNRRNEAIKKGYELFPSVFQMAKKAGYLDLYQYLYHSTSSVVHFRTDVLLKLGWNRDQEDKKHGIYRYSINNFSDYYSRFNLVYGGLLFCEFVFKFKSVLQLSNSLTSETKYFRESFDLFDWPEIMTYEHMNLQQPSETMKQMRRSQFVVANMRKKKKLR